MPYGPRTYTLQASLNQLSRRINWLSPTFSDGIYFLLPFAVTLTSTPTFCSRLLCCLSARKYLLEQHTSYFYNTNLKKYISKCIAAVSFDQKEAFSEILFSNYVLKCSIVVDYCLLINSEHLYKRSKFA